MIEYLAGISVVLLVILVAVTTHYAREKNAENKRLRKSQDECDKRFHECSMRCIELEKQARDAKAQTGARIGQLNNQKQEYDNRKERLKKEIQTVLNKWCEHGV